MFKCFKSSKKTKPIDKAKPTDNSRTPDEPYDQLYTYEEWHKDNKTRQVAHIFTNQHLVRFSYGFGIVSIIITAVTGSSIFAGIALDEGIPTENLAWYYAALAISILVTILTAIQTFLALPKRAQIHHQLSVEYGDLCNDIENHLHEYIEVHRDMEKLGKNMNKINDRMKPVDKGRPTIPQWLYKKAKNHVNHLIEIDDLKNYSDLLRLRERDEAKGLKKIPEIDDLQNSSL